MRRLCSLSAFRWLALKHERDAGAWRAGASAEQVTGWEGKRMWHVGRRLQRNAHAQRRRSSARGVVAHALGRELAEAAPRQQQAVDGGSRLLDALRTRVRQRPRTVAPRAQKGRTSR